MIQEYYLRAILNGTLNKSMEKSFVLECHELVLAFLELKWRQGALYAGQKPNHLYIFCVLPQNIEEEVLAESIVFSCIRKTYLPPGGGITCR
jgi:hypothetical protein